MDRVRIVGDDVVNGSLSGSYDVVAMKSVLQVLSPDEARRALSNVSSVMEPGGVLYVLGIGVLDNSRVSPPEAVAHNLVFLNLYDHGQAYTEQEHRDWLTAAGFDQVERMRLPSGYGMMTAGKQA